MTLTRFCASLFFKIGNFVEDTLTEGGKDLYCNLVNLSSSFVFCSAQEIGDDHLRLTDYILWTFFSASALHRGRLRTLLVLGFFVSQGVFVVYLPFLLFVLAFGHPVSLDFTHDRNAATERRLSCKNGLGDAQVRNAVHGVSLSFPPFLRLWGIGPTSLRCGDEDGGKLSPEEQNPGS